KRRPRLVLLIDGSRSMSAHARTALQMAVAVASVTSNVEVFTFSTALQRVTDEVRRVATRSEEHTSELQSLRHLVCGLLLEKKNLASQAGAHRPSQAALSRAAPIILTLCRARRPPALPAATLRRERTVAATCRVSDPPVSYT